jgi:hypothetical protein
MDRHTIGADPYPTRLHFRSTLAAGGGWSAPHPGWGTRLARALDTRLRPDHRATIRQRPEWRNWQTRGTQNPVSFGTCGFDPHLRHLRLEAAPVRGYPPSRPGSIPRRQLLVSKERVSSRNVRAGAGLAAGRPRVGTETHPWGSGRHGFRPPRPAATVCEHDGIGPQLSGRRPASPAGKIGVARREPPAKERARGGAVGSPTRGCGGVASCEVAVALANPSTDTCPHAGGAGAQSRNPR